jgi:hypothetical protein
VRKLGKIDPLRRDSDKCKKDVRRDLEKTNELEKNAQNVRKK